MTTGGTGAGAVGAGSGGGGAASGNSSGSKATVALKSGSGNPGSTTSSGEAMRSVGDGSSSMKAPGSATTSAATSISSSASAGRLASTTRSSSSGGAGGRIAIVSSNPVVSSRTGSAATRGTDGEEDPGPTAHRAMVSTSGVGVAAAGGVPGAARTVSGGGASTGRRGRMHCSITTSSSPGAPSQRMSPLRRTVPPGSSGLSLTCSARAAPVSWAMTRPASTTMRAWYGLTVGRSRRRPEPGAEPSVTVPLSGRTHRVPASGPPRTVKEADFVSAITPSRPRLEGRRKARRTPPF